MPPQKKACSQKPRSRGKSGPPASGRRLKALYAALILLGLLLLGLIALSQLRQPSPPAPPALTAPPAPPVAPVAPVAPPPVHPPKAAGRAAIIMDDLGRDLATARALLAIDLPVTFAILPGEAQAAEVAALAHRGGREVMIHIPMEPQSYPATNPGSDALLLGQSPEEIRRRFQGFVERVPFATGGNNHMGSRFTEYREGMEVVLAAMKEAGLFFVDSRTTGYSVALDEARRTGVPAAGRDLFLDNEQDVVRISRQIRQLAVLAGRRGQAVGICHPYPQTLEALRREAPYLKEQGIEIVPVSHLLER